MITSKDNCFCRNIAINKFNVSIRLLLLEENRPTRVTNQLLFIKLKMNGYPIKKRHFKNTKINIIKNKRFI